MANQSISVPGSVPARRHTGQVDAEPDADRDADRDAEPGAEPGAEPRAEGDGEAVTGPARRLNQTKSVAFTDPGQPLPASKRAVDPGGLPRQPTRRYSDVSEDDRDVGWGEQPAPSGRDDDWYLRERPPHHG